ncbi:MULTISPECIES: phosphodiester glycosidase family protein [Bacillus cereus group]|uniref:Branched-chain amino acid ABC transporter permease n=2 Tax=Bacillus cereus group TaxID=86661 RepID=A0A9X6WGF0_BACTU|nr:MULTISPECIES: phosphodiester glycosidase family protein [Bacillus cereus group]MDA1675109.1 phosphodiester glycosidase family protein [Bacillus cereus group sp. TH152-1LC]PDZ94047.1 branched-chain amino acid ABC transporter permease [Bacillus cereus]PFJ25046.1 branched-chain amino acid ABC transporter permease [Bacillus thuringiensis]
MKKFLSACIRFFVFCCFVGTIALFFTAIGHEVRVTIAEMILSSQHRDLAKYTFLPQEELDKILKGIQNPNYENSTAEGKNRRHYKGKDFENKDLVVKLEHIKKEYSPTSYYEGVILEVSNPLNVKLASSSLEKHGEQIFEIAERENALAAINASGFVDQNGHGNGGSLTGIAIEDGEIKNKYPDEKGFVAGITRRGEMVTGKYSGNELLDLGVKHAAGFKPQLIVNGKKMVEGDGGWGLGPRTAIGQKADGTIIMVVIDGRQPSRSIGASIKEVQDILYERGAINAMCMDGGSSSSMYFNGDNITIPSSKNNIPRYLPNIWAVVPKEGQKIKVYVDGEKKANSELNY